MSASHDPPPAGVAPTMLVLSVCSHVQFFCWELPARSFLSRSSANQAVCCVRSQFSVSRERSQLRIYEREPKSRCDVFFFFVVTCALSIKVTLYSVEPLLGSPQSPACRVK